MRSWAQAPAADDAPTATPGSRYSRYRGGAQSRLPSLYARTLVWHAACFVLSSCFYTAPAYRPPENQPPVIIRPTSLDNTLRLVADVETATVIAYDPEGANLFFRWFVPHGIPQDETTFQDDDLFISELRLARDDLFEGDLISCIVVDPAKADVEISWTVELP